MLTLAQWYSYFTGPRNMVAPCNSHRSYRRDSLSVVCEGSTSPRVCLRMGRGRSESYLCLTTCNLLLGALVLFVGCGDAVSTAHNRIELLHFDESSWRLSNGNGSITLAVGAPPVDAHTSLLAAGVLGAGLAAEPYYRYNDIEQRWVLWENWTFTGNVTMTASVQQLVASGGRVELVAPSLDTVGRLHLRDTFVGNVSNMFVRQVFDVTDIVDGAQEGESLSFRVDFMSAPAYAAIKNSTYPYPVSPQSRSPVEHGLNLMQFVRKEPCSFGWDWAPAFAPQAILAPVVLEGYSDFSLRDVAAVASTDGRYSADELRSGAASWTIDVEAYFAVAGSSNVSIYATIDVLPGAQASSTVSLPACPTGELQKVTLQVPVASGAQVWWPNGHGDQPLYTLVIAATDVSAPQGSPQQQKNVTVGFRTVELTQDPLPVPAGNNESFTFYFTINGVPTFMKGANWVPPDAFETRITKDTLYRLLSSAALANMNLIRVWGGGVYASDDMLQIADELGIMIWHEMMFGDSLYPADDAFLNSVATEVTENVRRIKSHPAVAIWVMNNEDEENLGSKQNSHWDPNLQAELRDYRKLDVETCIDNVTAEDPSRPYLGSSPTNGIVSAKHGWLAADACSWLSGDTHYSNLFDTPDTIDCWNPMTYPIPRFATEYGYFSWPSFLTMENVTNGNAGDWDFVGDLMSHRDHHPNGNKLMLSEMALHYAVPPSKGKDGYAQTLWMTQVVQAECIRMETEHYRRQRSVLDNRTGYGGTMASMYWQLDDMWQAQSWSSLELRARWKVLHYSAKKFYAPVALSSYVLGGSAHIAAVNDGSLAAKNTVVTVEVWRMDRAFASGGATPLKVFSSEPFDLNARSSTPHAIWSMSIADIAKAAGCPTTIVSPVGCAPFNRSGCGGGQWKNYWGSSMSASQFGDTYAGPCMLRFFADGNVETSEAPVGTQILAPHFRHIDFQDPRLALESVASVDDHTFNISGSAAAPAAYVWLETTFEGYFSDNGFFLFESSFSLTFTSYRDAAVPSSSQLRDSLQVWSYFNIQLSAVST